MRGAGDLVQRFSKLRGRGRPNVDVRIRSCKFAALMSLLSLPCIVVGSLLFQHLTIVNVVVVMITGDVWVVVFNLYR